MSDEQLKAFLDKVKADSSLQLKLKAAADANAVLEIARDAGFMISVDDLKNVETVDLSDEELEGLAGGYCTERTMNLGTLLYGCSDDCTHHAMCK